MAQNRVATPLEEQSIRAFLARVAAARERQIADAKRQARRAARDVAQAEARLAEDREAVQRATLDLEQVVIANTQAKEFLEMAQRPLDDDPHIRLQKGLIHPIRRLPTEILTMLFEASLRSVDEYSGLPAKYRAVQRIPYTLALVCRRWRDVALAVPSLWRYICIDLGALRKENLGIYKFYLETSFTRSAQRDVALHAQHLSWDWEQPSRPEWLRPDIAAIIRRDGVVDLNVSPLELGFFDHANPSIGLRNLEAGAFAPTELVHALPSLAPNLRTLSVDLSALMRPPPASYPSVERVEVACLHLGELQPGRPHPYENLLGFLPNARMIRFRFSDDFGTADHLRHDHVQTLSLDSLSKTAHFAERYTFSQLRELEIKMPYLACNDAERRHLQLLVNGCANLRKLRIEAPIVLSSDFASMLRSTPRLESLSFSDCQPDESFLQVLGKVGDDGVWVCPRLTTLHLDDVAEGMDKNIIETIEARRAAHRRGERIADLENVLGDIARSLALLHITQRFRRIQASLGS